MDNRPIGVFDSGVGGLTAVSALRRLLPSEDVIFFGDSARMPYGDRTGEEITAMAEQVARRLEAMGVKALLAACNTIDSNALPVLREKLPLPVFGVVAPTAALAVKTTKNRTIAVIATEATVRSGAYRRAIGELDGRVSVLSLACPGLAPMVERGRFSRGDPEAEAAVEECLAGLADSGADTLVLGCTHYPLLSGVIGGLMGPEVRLVDSSAAGAAGLAEFLRESRMLREDGSAGTCTYYTSGDEKTFAGTVELFLGGDAAGAVRRAEPFEL